MKKINTEDAIGIALCHDITKIVKGGFKGAAFKKGHVITEEDVAELLNLGKDHIYIWEEEEGYLHENEGAERLKNLVAGEGIEFGNISEGKIEFFAKHDGYLKINYDDLIKINMIEDLLLSTAFGNVIVKKGAKIGATKVVPLAIKEEKIIFAEREITKPIIEVKEFLPKKVSIITTGSEVFHGRIKDAFKPVLEKKLSKFNCEIVSHVILPDDSNLITEEINKAHKLGAELILCTGGMSVDPDDLTPSSIKNSGAEIITYGTPVFPGAMFLVAYKNNTVVMGLPGSVMFFEKTVFDLLLPLVLINEKITKKTVATLSYGGLL